jgi:tRNA(fMet)-specific endonuclease VapC
VKLILDTNALSALMKGDQRAVRRLRETPKSDVSVPQTVLAEIAYGLARLPRSRRKQALRERFDLLSTELGRASWTDAVSEHFGAIKAEIERRGRRIEDFDAAIAAHAMAVDAALVTADAKHMPRVPGLTVIDWVAS